MVSTKSCPARALQASELPPVMYVQPSASLAARAPTPTPEATVSQSSAAMCGQAAALLVSQSPGSTAQSVTIAPLENRMPEWSIGATFHAVAQCRPCTWFWRPQGCINGESCRHCHMCPVGEVKARRKNRLAILRSSIHEVQAATSTWPDLTRAPSPPPAAQTSGWTTCPAFLGCHALAS